MSYQRPPMDSILSKPSYRTSLTHILTTRSSHNPTSNPCLTNNYAGTQCFQEQDQSDSSTHNLTGCTLFETSTRSGRYQAPGGAYSAFHIPGFACVYANLFSEKFGKSGGNYGRCARARSCNPLITLEIMRMCSDFSKIYVR